MNAFGGQSLVGAQASGVFARKQAKTISKKLVHWGRVPLGRCIW
jgi:hypothetical protein